MKILIPRDLMIDFHDDKIKYTPSWSLNKKKSVKLIKPV